jgi:predicted transposase YbfD/YdcC
LRIVKSEIFKQAQWSGLQTIEPVVRTRHLWNKTTTEVMFYLSSLPPDAQTLGKAIRRHWSVENQLHWVLDAGQTHLNSVSLVQQRFQFLATKINNS